MSCFCLAYFDNRPRVVALSLVFVYVSDDAATSNLAGFRTPDLIDSVTYYM
jgi:hypothetical protein